MPNACGCSDPKCCRDSAQFKALESRPGGGEWYKEKPNPNWLMTFLRASVRGRDFGRNWTERERIAAATATFDYDCRFNAEGGCKSYPKPVKNPRLCCQGCYDSVGYLSTIPAAAVAPLAALFDNKLGFWRPGVGCTMPRKWRSVTCLRYQCGYDDAARARRDQLIQIGLPRY
jgi:hypothetical protein